MMEGSAAVEVWKKALFCGDQAKIDACVFHAVIPTIWVSSTVLTGDPNEEEEAPLSCCYACGKNVVNTVVQVALRVALSITGLTCDVRYHVAFMCHGCALKQGLNVRVSANDGVIDKMLLEFQNFIGTAGSVVRFDPAGDGYDKWMRLYVAWRLHAADKLLGYATPTGGCGECWKFAPKLLQCSGCKFMHYCSKECSVSDWSRHKPECKRLRDSHLLYDDKLLSF